MRQTQVGHLTALECGVPLPTSITFRAELSGLSRLNQVPFGFPTPSDQEAANNSRGHSIAHIVPSPDRSLAAIASTSGRIEIHQPSFADSHRLTIGHASHKYFLSRVVYPSCFDGDHLFAVVSFGKSIYHYDIQNCRADEPTTRFQCARHRGCSILDVFGFNHTCLAAVCPNRLLIFDMRQGRNEIMSTEAPLSNAPVITMQEHLIMIGAEKSVLVYDWRFLPRSNDSSRKVMSFQSGPTSNAFIRSIDCSNRSRSGFGFLSSLMSLPGAADGLLAFHTNCGTVGTVDVTSGSVRSLEEPLPPVPGSNGLHDFGHAESTLDRLLWRDNCRAVDIIRGNGGRGWRVVVPNVLKSGVRVVAISDDMPLQQFDIPALRALGATSALAVDGNLDKLLIGTGDNEVYAYRVDLDRSNRERQSVHQI